MKTNENAQKMISAKIAKKLVELANKYVVPCININMPGRYSASQLYDEKDAFGKKLYYSFDKDKCAQIMPADNEFCVSVNASDFTAEEMAILGYEPKFRLQIKPDNIFYAISKFEQLAGLQSTDRAKFIIGEPETIYETERAKVVLFDYAKQRITTKTKTLTIISDWHAIYLNKKDNYAFCLKINGKWINVHNQITYFNLEEIIERVKKYITYKCLKSASKKYIANNTDAYADFVRMILSELEAMEQGNAEAVENCNANGDSNVNAEAKESAEALSTSEGDKCSGGDDGRKQANAPQSTESAAQEQSKREKPKGRKIADLSEFCGCGDKRYHPSGENRNMGIYGGKSGVSQETSRGSPAKASIYYLTRV